MSAAASEWQRAHASRVPAKDHFHKCITELTSRLPCWIRITGDRKSSVQFKVEMLQSEEREREILLGNKQLLGIFFVVAALLGIAFAGGYKLGQSSAGKKPAPVVGTGSTAAPETASTSTPPAGETHSVAPEESVATAAPGNTGAHRKSEVLLGAPKQKSHPASATDNNMLVPAKGDGFAPQSGQEFLAGGGRPARPRFSRGFCSAKEGIPGACGPETGRRESLPGNCGTDPKRGRSLEHS